ncbi:amidohydrolase family protein [Phaeosphaeriaceae sp. PMI808]|nr:amidohydrolase family protein [Phaeosphaeriaceae sp. PMI808]
MGKIDVHHHMLPTEYMQKWDESGVPKLFKVLPPWNVQLDLAFMDRNGIDASILSLSAPGITFLKSAEESGKLCRWVNEYSAKIRGENPSRFGFFATLPPIGQIESCLVELRHALDVLKADGVILFTSYDDKYLGHSSFRPIWEELNHRGAVVFVHPIVPKTSGATSDPTIPRPIVDFPHETTRTAVSMIKSNTIRDYPNCKIILSHAGGTLPYVAPRIAYLNADLGPGEKSAEEFLEDAKNFYYDLALSGFQTSMDLLKGFAKEDHILYGSDFPFAREATIATQVENIRTNVTEDQLRHSIECGAAQNLFPRFLKSQI